MDKMYVQKSPVPFPSYPRRLPKVVSTSVDTTRGESREGYSSCQLTAVLHQHRPYTRALRPPQSRRVAEQLRRRY